MKRIVRPLLLTLALSALLCVSAFAADEAGLYGATQTDDYMSVVSFSYYKADGTEVTEPTAVDEVNVYNEAVKLGVRYNAATPFSQYVILVTNTELTSGAALTDAAIEYIDQKAADVAILDFTVYQKDFDAAKTYYVYLASDAAAGIQSRTLVGTYRWYEAAPAYTLGDVDDDGDITILDAQSVLYHSVGRRTLTDKNLLAADVNGDGDVNVLDAQRILYFSVGRIKAF